MGSTVPFNMARVVMLTHTMRNLRDAVEKSCKLNAVQTRILCFLDLKGDSFQVGKLAESLKLSASLATKTIASLELSGYVNRIDDQSDRRMVNVSLTEKGKQMAAHLWEVQGSIITRDYYLIQSALKLNDQKKIETPYTAIYHGVIAGNTHSIFTLTEHYAESWQILTHHTRLHDISLNAYFILLILHINEDEWSEISPSDVATFLLLKKTVISHALSELVSQGYVNCHRSRLDRRKNVLDLTNEGYALVADLTPALYDDLYRISFPEASEEEIKALDSSASYFAEAMRQSFHP